MGDIAKFSHMILSVVYPLTIQVDCSIRVYLGSEHYLLVLWSRNSINGALKCQSKEKLIDLLSF